MNGSSLMFRRLAQRRDRYPFADMPVWAKRAVLDAIRAAFDDAMAADLRFEGENDLSAILVDGLNDLRRDTTVVPAFSAKLFQVVSRDGCAATFDGANLQKRPDIVFRLATALDEYEGWFTECKIVDSTHPPRLYLSNGVNRFIAGDYAWAMPTALMLAYAGQGYDIGTVSGLTPVKWEHDPSIFVSEHNRAWCYVGGTCAPGPVGILHLWLHGASFAGPK